MTNSLSTSFEDFYESVSEIIETARGTVYREVNLIMVKTYWQIGRAILEEQQQGRGRAEYGKALLEILAECLTQRYGKSFSNRNLRYMRQFYKVFPKWNAVRSELSWTHYRLLLRVEKETARDYYMKEASECNWSTRTLERQINSLYFERLLMSSEESRALVKKEAEDKKEEMQPSHIIKDPYVLEFLNLKANTGF